MSTSLPALDYASPPSARWRWMRWLRRGWPVGMLLIVAGLGIAYGPGVWRRWQVLRLQEACMRAELPADRQMYEIDPAAAQALIAARPGEYQLDQWGRAARLDSRWVALAGALGVPAWQTSPPWWPPATLFCHERHTPDGRRRLVVFEGEVYVTVIEPAAWPVGDGPRVLRREEMVFDAADRDALHATIGVAGRSRSGAGVPDPADRSRFTVPFVQNGVPGTAECRLGNDDRVTMHLLDPPGFVARAKAARAAEAPPAPLPRPSAVERGM